MAAGKPNEPGRRDACWIGAFAIMSLLGFWKRVLIFICLFRAGAFARIPVAALNSELRNEFS